MKHILRSILFVAALVGLFSSSVFAQAPTTTYPVGVRQYNWTRGSRAITTYIYYPAASGTVGQSPVTNAPVAPGVFPIALFMHGFSSSPQNSLFVIRRLAEAGFIVPGPYFPNLNINDIGNGELPRDISQVITNTIALNNTAPFTGQINTVQVGVSGHSMGGMTIDGLLTAYPDSRIKAAVPMSCTDQGTPSSSVVAKILFIHGDADTTCPYSSARQAYSEEPPTKAFLTFIGGSHTSMWSDQILPTTTVDWMRWALYNDSAAHDRLASDAASSHTKWEIVESGGTSLPPAGTYSLRSRSSGLMLDNLGVSSNGADVGQWADGSSNNQRWVLSYVSSTVVKLQCVTGGRYLDGMGRTTSSANVGQYDNSTSNNQRWTIVSVGSGYFKLKNVATGVCLDVGSSPWPNGDLVQQYTDGSSQNQHWQFVAP